MTHGAGLSLWRLSILASGVPKGREEDLLHPQAFVPWSIQRMLTSRDSAHQKPLGFQSWLLVRVKVSVQEENPHKSFWRLESLSPLWDFFYKFISEAVRRMDSGKLTSYTLMCSGGPQGSC